MGTPPTEPIFRPTAPPPQPWVWRLEDSSGSEVEVSGELAGRSFPSQADAESWLGENYAALAEHGVDQVTLLEADRVVYGPMSLHP